MSDQDKEDELLQQAKITILTKIIRASDTGVGMKGILDLAMAYTVLDRGKLPGETPKSS